MAQQDRYGRRLTPRGSSPPSSLRSEDILRAARLPQSNCFTERQVRPVAESRQQRTLRGRNGLQTGGGPRIPRNRIGSAFASSVEHTRVTMQPSRTSSATVLYSNPVSPPPERQRRVPPVVHTIGYTTGKPKPPSTTIPGYRARCISDSDSEDDVQTDYVHESIKTNPEMLHFSTNVSDSTHSHNKLSLNLTSTILQKQDSGIDQEMDTLQSPKSPVDESVFDPKTYQKHLDEIQRNATEWSRVQDGLAMLLPNVDGDTGFHQAVIHTNPIILKKLLELVNKYPQLNSSVNDQNSLYQTCLHLAVHLQQTDMIRMLLNAGALLHLQDHKGNTPLHIACQQKSTICLDQILSTVNHRTLSELSEIRNNEGHSCVHAAALSNNTQAMLKLQGAGVDINMKSYGSGKTALHIAIEKGSFQLTQILIQSCGADFNIPMYSGCTPLHIAAGWGNIEIVAYLISLGADPYAVTDEGDMAVDLVSNNEGVKQFLIAVTGI